MPESNESRTPEPPVGGAPLEPVRRSFTERPTGRRLRDVDTARRARITKALAWGLFPAGIIGGLLFVMEGPLAGLTGAAIIMIISSGFAILVSEGGGAAAGQLLHPSTGVRPRGTSRAEALLAQGRFQEAADAWEVHAAEDPHDPEAAAQVARVHRDHLSDPDGAVQWFRRSVARAGAGPEARVMVRELLEAARKSSRGEAAAAPDLARYAEANAGTPEAEWALAQLAAIKAAMREALEAGEDRPPADENEPPAGG